MIDCIVWAPTEACRTIDASNYMNGMVVEEIKDGEEMNGVAEEGKEEEGEAGADKAAATDGNTAGEDESRATANTRLTTKERI